jgi:rRNA-processing protein FCF1
MSASRNKPTGLIADANVLIDYADSTMSVLKLISQHIAPIHVPSPVFQEVAQLSEEKAINLGINVVEPALEQALEAQAEQGSTSFQDRLCFVTVRDMGCSVLTNDVALRKACDNNGIGCLWGMEAMAILVKRITSPLSERWRLRSESPTLTILLPTASSNNFTTKYIHKFTVTMSSVQMKPPCLPRTK